MPFALSPAGQADIEELYERGKNAFGEAQADAYLLGLLDVLDIIGRHPELARLRTGTEPPIRAHPYERHIIVYRDEGATARILRVRHGREDWLRQLVEG